MVNPRRGEVEVEADGAKRVLRLTLGSLAELEDGLGAEGLVGLAERFEGGRFRTRDVIATLAAGFRGAGVEVDERAVASMAFTGGAAGAAIAAARLLSAAFSGEERDGA